MERSDDGEIGIKLSLIITFEGELFYLTHPHKKELQIVIMKDSMAD